MMGTPHQALTRQLPLKGKPFGKQLSMKGYP